MRECFSARVPRHHSVAPSFHHDRCRRSASVLPFPKTRLAAKFLKFMGAQDNPSGLWRAGFYICPRLLELILGTRTQHVWHRISLRHPCPGQHLWRCSYGFEPQPHVNNVTSLLQCEYSRGLCSLYGLNLHQAFQYLRNFPNDSMFVKTIVRPSSRLQMNYADHRCDRRYGRSCECADSYGSGQEVTNPGQSTGNDEQRILHAHNVRRSSSDVSHVLIVGSQISAPGHELL